MLPFLLLNDSIAANKLADRYFVSHAEKVQLKFYSRWLLIIRQVSSAQEMNTKMNVHYEQCVHYGAKRIETWKILRFYIRALIHVICALFNVLSFAMLMTRTLLYTLYMYKERGKETVFIFRKMYIFTFLINFFSINMPLFWSSLIFKSFAYSKWLLQTLFRYTCDLIPAKEFDFKY